MFELHQACVKGDIDEIIKLVLQENHDINQAMPDGSTPVIIALKNGHLNIASFLIGLSHFRIDPPVRQDVFNLLNSITLQQTGPVDIQRQTLLHRCYFQLGDHHHNDVDYAFPIQCFQKAYENINIAISHAGNDHDVYIQKAVNTLSKLAELLGADDHLMLAHEKLQFALNLIDKTKDKNQEYINLKIKILKDFLNIIKHYLSIGEEFQRLNQPDKALEVFQKIIEIRSTLTEIPDELYKEVSFTLFSIGQIHSKKLFGREKAKKNYQSSIEELLNIQTLKGVHCDYFFRPYFQLSSLYETNEPGYSVFDLMQKCFNLNFHNNDLVNQFIKTHGFITDQNNWQLAKPFYQSFLQFCKAIMRTYHFESYFNVSIRKFLQDEANLDLLNKTIAFLEGSAVISLENTINSSTAPLLAFARHQQQDKMELETVKKENKELKEELGEIKSLLQKQGLFKKRKADDDSINEEHKEKRHKPEK